MKSSRRPLQFAAAMLLCTVAPVRAQLAPPNVPPENPVSHVKALLGKILFWDEQLSSDNSMACGTCHVPARGGGDPRLLRTPGPDGQLFTLDDVFGSPGVIHSDAYQLFSPAPNGSLAVQVTGRNAPTFIGASYFTSNFWDGRALTKFIDPQTGNVSIVAGGALESQLVGPPVSSVEMGHDARTWDQVVVKLESVVPLALSPRVTIDVAILLQSHPTYPSLFRRVFGDKAITSERIAFAIATYERSLIPDQTPWDRFAAGDNLALTPDEAAGLAIFTGTRARCSVCHPTPLFADDAFHNIGVRPPAEDLGLQNTTGNTNDRGKFKTPTLRNVGLRRHFMHNGRFGDLLQVIQFYERGGDFGDNRDPLMIPFTLPPSDEAKLLEFISHALTDPRVELGMPPFDRPLLHSEGPANPSLYGDDLAGSGGYVPQMLAPCPPLIGYEWFKLGVGDALGGATAFLLLGGEAAPPGTQVNGIPVNVALSPPPLLLPFTLQGVGAGAGYGTFAFKIPSNPQLAGQDWFAQWVIVDAGGVGGFAASEGVRFEFF